MPRQKEFNEQEVLEKAVALFWEKGYHASSMQDIVETLGLSRSSIYGTFGDKRALFEKAFEAYRVENYNRLKTFFDTQESVKEGFYLLLSQAIRSSLNDPARKGCMVVNCTTEFAGKDAEISKILQGNRAEVEKLFVEFLKKGVASGEIDASRDLQTMASLIFALYSGLQVMSKMETERDNFDEVIRQGLAFIS
jgi:TetR/AcrR family transcriptional repressor of nem operon